MRTGLYPLSVIARFLGQKPTEMTRQVEMDGMPAIQVATATRPALKVPLPAFHRWLLDRSQGTVLTLDELREELARCEEQELGKLNNKDAKKTRL